MAFGVGTTIKFDCDHSREHRNPLWKKEGIWFLTTNLETAIDVIERAIYHEAISHRNPMILEGFEPMYFCQIDHSEFYKRVSYIIENGLFFIAKMKGYDEIENKLRIKFETFEKIGHNSLKIHAHNN